MIVASYLALFVALLVWTGDPEKRRWAQNADRRSVATVRIAGCVVCVLLMLAGLLLLADGTRSEVGVAAGIALVAGASALILGIGLWKGGLARSLRVTGWLVVVAVLCIPSTLTLLLLPVAPMVVLLELARSSPRSRERNEIVRA